MNIHNELLLYVIWVWYSSNMAGGLTVSLWRYHQSSSEDLSSDMKSVDTFSEIYKIWEITSIEKLR